MSPPRHEVQSVGAPAEGSDAAASRLGEHGVPTWAEAEVGAACGAPAALAGTGTCHRALRAPSTQPRDPPFAFTPLPGPYSFAFTPETQSAPSTFIHASGPHPSAFHLGGTEPAPHAFSPGSPRPAIPGSRPHIPGPQANYLGGGGQDPAPPGARARARTTTPTMLCGPPHSPPDPPPSLPEKQAEPRSLATSPRQARWWPRQRAD